MPAAPIPWEPSNIPTEILEEFKRRKRNISLNYINADKVQGTWIDGEWKNYKGPTSAWVRVCSNGRGRPNADGVFDSKRFVFFGGKEFESTYGFKTIFDSPNWQIIGYMPDGTPHGIDNDQTTAQAPIHIPTPEISRVEMVIQKEVLRRATIEWVCFSWKQLEYMTPYFLVPGITVMIEMGWNHFNPSSLVDLTDENLMKSLMDNPYPLYEKNIIESNGNYDVIYGTITNFNWSVEGNNRYVCSTEITSKNRLYAGLPISSEVFDRSFQPSKNTDESKEILLGNLYDFINSSAIINNFRTVARSGLDVFLKRESATVYKEESTSKTYVGGNVGGQVMRQPATVEKVSPNFEGPYEEFMEQSQRALETSGASEEKRNLRLSYMYQVFDGRSTGDTFQKTSTVNKFDFDTTVENEKQVWFSMGLIVSIINHFSARNGVTSKNPFIELDIDNVVIGGHPNLISADGGVMLIPNFEAPKYFYGSPGVQQEDARLKTIEKERDSSPYLTQYLPKGITSKARPADNVLRYKFYQTYIETNSAHPGVLRDNHDEMINRNLYKLNKENSSNQSAALAKKGERSFPVHDPKSGKERPYYGFLRDIYFNVGTFKKLVERYKGKSYYELMKAILSELNRASAGFWDLNLADAKGKWVVADLNFVGRDDNKNANGEVLVIDMHDMDNYVKAFRFRPQLSDMQATRTIYGEATNRDTRFYQKDERTDMDWRFKDSLFQNTLEESEKSYLAQKKQKSISNWQSVLRSIQNVDDPNDQSVYQMKIDTKNTSGYDNTDEYGGKYLYLKLALPARNGINLLRTLTDDGDEENNSKYCAIQPNINAEITFQGIGGLRTFQCLLVRNLPEPYSERDIVFQIINVMDNIEAGKWETTIVAGIRPLRKSIKNALNITDEIIN